MSWSSFIHSVWGSNQTRLILTKSCRPQDAHLQLLSEVTNLFPETENGLHFDNALRHYLFSRHSRLSLGTSREECEVHCGVLYNQCSTIQTQRSATSKRVHISVQISAGDTVSLRLKAIVVWRDASCDLWTSRRVWRWRLENNPVL